MSNYVAADPIAAGRQFAVFRDAMNEPASLSIGTDNVLYLSMNSHNEASSMDLGKSIGLSGDVQAFALHQNPDLSMDISIAVASKTGSELSILHNVLPDELAGPIAKDKILQGPGFDTIYNLFMVCLGRLPTH
jgi:hypothetical protein